MSEPPNNALRPLPDTFDPNIGFEAKRIVHAILTLGPMGGPADSPGADGPLWLQFKVADPADLAPDPKAESIEDYALRMAGFAFERGIKEPRSPYDIMIERQSWVLVELDSRVANWQFTKGEFGCTTKQDYGRDNFGLRHVYRDGLGGLNEPVTKDGCRFLFFGAARRDAGTEDNPASQYFNFHVEFLQTHPGEKVERRLKVIFDPDVGNNGGFPIPP
ncbi:nucleotide synthetase [Phenylobacterium sp. J367]|uniref:nucleotide synthetase n=1 Tax=Phenylobacterium sp. J367 TaxID=2898435 RepID=UPI002151C19C|nr:nucleotide synthetase [Phenylobacterium sp. J367]MCR5879193.1 hypothetical protein [Phenylobacterium sp. J367]